jgi:hypothetical protein
MNTTELSVLTVPIVARRVVVAMFALVILTGCATEPAPWLTPTRERLADSRAPGPTREWVLRTIAAELSRASNPRLRCDTPALMSVEQLPLDDVVDKRPDGSTEILRPVRYAERWHVQACGAFWRWRLLGLLERNDLSGELLR